MTKLAPGYALDTTWRTLFKDLGVVPANVLRRAGLADDLLHQPAVRLASADYYRLWAGLEAELGDALLPLRLVEAIRSESFSPLLFAALCSPNLLVALRRVASYKALIGPMHLSVAELPGRVVVELAWQDAPLVPPASLVLLELLVGVALARMGTRELVRPLSVTTPEPPAVPGPYEAYLGTRIRQGERHQVVYAPADAARPFLTSNEQLWAAFEPGLRQRLADLDAAETTARRVQAALLEGLPSGLVAIETVADKLAVSKRTLQRRIEAEGTSYQQILQQTREALARHYLEKTGLPTIEIAFLLGFEEPTSFHRAFRTWTGLTPESLRHPGRQAAGLA